MTKDSIRHPLAGQGDALTPTEVAPKAPLVGGVGRHPGHHFVSFGDLILHRVDQVGEALVNPPHTLLVALQIYRPRAPREMAGVIGGEEPPVHHSLRLVPLPHTGVERWPLTLRTWEASLCGVRLMTRPQTVSCHSGLASRQVNGVLTSFSIPPESRSPSTVIELATMDPSACWLATFRLHANQATNAYLINLGNCPYQPRRGNPYP